MDVYFDTALGNILCSKGHLLQSHEVSGHPQAPTRNLDQGGFGLQ